MIVIKNKYDWSLIQADYDSGLTQRELREKHGVQMQAIAKARKRGDFESRGSGDAARNSIARHGPRISMMSEAARKKLSIRQSTNNSGGKCKWFEVSGQRVQGTWERDLALKMDVLGIQWIKCSETIQYELDGKWKRYTPDFYLPEFGMYVELKGYWWGDDRRKMDAVLDQHSRLRLIVVEKDEFLAAMAV